MDLQQFEALENKISQAVKTIQTLKTENKDLRQRLSAMEQQHRDRDEQFARLQAEMSSVHERSEETRQLREREEKIRSKVEDMLAKLEELQLQL